MLRAPGRGWSAAKDLGLLPVRWREILILADEVLRVSANVGIAIFPIDASEGEELLRCADFAMYQARYDGRNNYRLFSPRSPNDPSA